MNFKEWDEQKKCDLCRWMVDSKTSVDIMNVYLYRYLHKYENSGILVDDICDSVFVKPLFMRMRLFNMKMFLKIMRASILEKQMNVRDRDRDDDVDIDLTKIILSNSMCDDATVGTTGGDTTGCTVDGTVDTPTADDIKRCNTTMADILSKQGCIQIMVQRPEIVSDGDIFRWLRTALPSDQFGEIARTMIDRCELTHKEVVVPSVKEVAVSKFLRPFAVSLSCIPLIIIAAMSK